MYNHSVPVYKKESQDEIQTIWHFGVYDNRLYHFTLNRPQSTIVEEYWKFDCFTLFALSELEWYINFKGELYDYSTTEILDAHIEDVVEYFHETTDYKGFKFDESQKGLSIFENLNVLTKGC